jgi:predicted oxidoreductase
MKSINIGGMNVSILGLGCMRICRKPKEEMDVHLKTALEAGVNFFDHADVYGFGNSEKMFGEIFDLQSDFREKIFIQSKCTLVRDAAQTLYNDQSREYILYSVDEILKRLNTDYLDVFLLHSADTLVEPDEVAEAFDVLHSSGKVRCFGVSNHQPLQIELLKKYLRQPIVVSQVQFSVAHPDLVDASLSMRLRGLPGFDAREDLLTYCRLNDIPLQAWSPFQFGFYGGIYLGNEKYPALNSATSRMAEEKRVSPSAIAVAWILRHPARIQPLIGTTNSGRLREIVKAVDVEMSRAEWYELYRAQLSDEGKNDLGSSAAKPAK